MESSNQHLGSPIRPLMNQDTSRPVHGSIRPAELRRLGLDPGSIIDFSASISPLGPPAGLWDALRGVDLANYPDPECLELKEALAKRLGVDTNQILVGNGTTEIIHLLARAYLSASNQGVANTALLLTPTYGEYAGACRLSGGSIFKLAAQYQDGFGWDIPEARTHIGGQRPSLVFVCNPNNPTGVYLPEADIGGLAQAVAQVDGLLVLDEAYVSFVDDPWDWRKLLEQGNLVVLRSMTKDYALTGLRLGYSLASPEVTDRLASFQPDWSVNSLAQAAGLVALADTEYLPKARQMVNQAKGFLTEQLSKTGFRVQPSAANFLLVQVGNGTIMRDKLLERALVVRDCTSFGLPDYIRIGVRSLDDCQRLVEAMAEVKVQVE